MISVHTVGYVTGEEPVLGSPNLLSWTVTMLVLCSRRALIVLNWMVSMSASDAAGDAISSLQDGLLHRHP